MRLAIVTILVFGLLAGQTNAWDASDFEVFDAVEEVNANFYELLGVSPTATLQEIKRAFRTLSVQLHPDKNPAPDADVKFRNLVSVYDILKDSEKRAKYDLVLKNGMPSWKSGIWYYRKMRKMGLWESALILFSIITVSQYLIAWGAYVEKKHTAEEVLGNKWKKIQKKSKTGMEFADVLNEIPRPSVLNTLPFQIPKFFWHLPRNIKNIVTMVVEMKREEKARKQQEAEAERLQQEADEEYLQKKEEMKALKKRKIFVAPEKTEQDLKGFAIPTVREDSGEAVRAVNSTSKPIAGGFWTDEDLIELVRLVKKYPGGMTNRWETIAEVMNRSVTEVTFMAAKMKERGYKVPGSKPDNSTEIPTAEEPKLKTKKKAVDATINVPVKDWSQDQQRALETAISKYPKNTSGDRWQKISNSVPGKTKEECMLRYKYLVEMVKKQKEEEARAQAAAEEAAAAEAEKEQEIETVEDVEEGQEEEPVDTSKGKGKPRNKRKDRKKQIDLDAAYEELEDDE